MLYKIIENLVKLKILYYKQLNYNNIYYHKLYPIYKVCCFSTQQTIIILFTPLPILNNDLKFLE